MNRMYKLESSMPHTAKLIKMMCDIVDAPYEVINRKNWYTKYTWNENQREFFKQYFINYLYLNSDARREIMSIPIKNKKTIAKVFSWFDLDYGWKLE
jgi:hypothetical protein